MARLLTVLTLIAVFSSCACADTTWVSAGPVSGFWSRHHSPYMIQGDISIPKAHSLNIGPGVTVFFTGHYSLFADSANSFTAIGAEGDSVRFTTDTLANPWWWGGVRVYGPANPLRFSYCIFEFADARDSSLGGALLATGSLELEHSTLRFNKGGEGGGLLAQYCDSLLLSNCTIEDNQAELGGGGSFRHCQGRVEDCLFRGNYAVAAGGGAEFWNWSNAGLNVSRCEILGNRTGWWGGGIWFEQDGSKLEDCIISGNVSTETGGGVMIVGSPSFTRCTFFDNYADSAGGGVCSQGGTEEMPVTLDRCVVACNRAGDGGGLCLKGNGYSLIQRSTILSNAATRHGGGIWNSTDAYSKFLGNIVAFTSQGEGIAYPPSGGNGFRNCGFFGNAAGNFFRPKSTTLGVVNTINANGDSCDSYLNVYLNPLIADLTHGDFHLAPTSPCIDAGPLCLPRDPDGTIADLGAFSFDQANAVRAVALRPSSFTLSAYPNPFNPETRIAFSLPRAGDVRLEIYDLLGRRTATLVEGKMSAGAHSVNFDGSRLPSGIYFSRLTVGKETVSQKLLLLK